jgi:hypothetical protein
VTTAYIPTAGELAGQTLSHFTELQAAAGMPDADRVTVARRAAVLLVQGCLDLMSRFPAEARPAFAAALPFSVLEMQLIVRGPVDEEPIAGSITERLLEWATRSPVFVDELSVHAADFLARLTPHLDLWSQRQLAAIAAERLTRL